MSILQHIGLLEVALIAFATAVVLWMVGGMRLVMRALGR